MYSEFAYSSHMQVILAIVSYAGNFISTYMISNIILTAFDVSASRNQKMVFAFISGPILQVTFVYVVFLFSHIMVFNNLTYYLVVNPNPITALLYYYTAQKIFQLPPARSVKLMSYIYIFWITSNALNRLVGAIFFTQNRPQYNYLLDASQQAVTLGLFFLICSVVLALLRKSHASLNFSENMFFNRKKELFGYLMQVSFVYAVTVSIPLVLSNQVIAHMIVCLILILLIITNICIDMVRYHKQIISNRDVHISALFKGLEELRGIKHDFNNILHTYSGYLELGEYERLKIYHASLVSATSQAGNISDIAQKMSENPAIVSLLINKFAYAERVSVRLLITLKCGLANFYIDNLAIARVLSCLLDHAIELASNSDQRKVYCTIESKLSRSKLIIITNSASPAPYLDDTQKNGNTEMILPDVRNILRRYGNCSFQIQYRDQEVSAYMELREAN